MWSTRSKLHQAEFEDAGLELGTTTEQADPNIAVGLIISQDPAAQELLEEGGAVNVTVSTGAPQAQVPPGLVGMQFNDAQQAIQDAGLRIGSVSTDQESDAPDNEVTATDPAPGTEVAAGTAVNITISGGQLAIPNVVGQDQGAAQAALTSAGFEVRVQEEIATGEQPGTVFAQDPPGGERRPAGSLVVIRVALAPPETTTPPHPNHGP